MIAGSVCDKTRYICDESVAHPLHRRQGRKRTPMSQPSTPRDYALAHLCRLESLWSGVHDGEIDAVHDARIATRRIRSALPFVYTAPPAVTDELRRIGRALGRVRELDATRELLTTLEGRASDAAAAIGVARHEVDGQLTRQRRRMVKKLKHRPRSIARAMAPGFSVGRFSSLWRSWRHELRDAIQHAATDAQAALDHATAVYMPNRAHAARIAVKKLRYLVELGAATGAVDDAAVAGLKSAQDALGDLHDMTMLGKMVDQVQFPRDLLNESRALAAVVRAETARLHARYVRRRDRIRGACDESLRSVEHQPLAPLALPAAAIVAVPVLASWYLRHNDEDDRRVAQYRLTS